MEQFGRHVSLGPRLTTLCRLQKAALFPESKQQQTFFLVLQQTLEPIHVPRVAGVDACHTQPISFASLTLNGRKRDTPKSVSFTASAAANAMLHPSSSSQTLCFTLSGDASSTVNCRSLGQFDRRWALFSICLLSSPAQVCHHLKLSSTQAAQCHCPLSIKIPLNAATDGST